MSITAGVERSSNGLIWPTNLGDIKISVDERTILEKKIVSSKEKLFPRTASNEPMFYVPKSPLCPRRLDIGHDHAFVVLNRHGGMPMFDKTGAQQKSIKFVWDCISGSFWLKKRGRRDKQDDALRYVRYGLAVGRSESGFPRIVNDSCSASSKGKSRYFEKKASHSLPEWLKEFGPNFDVGDIIGLIDALRKIHAARYEPAKFCSMFVKGSYSSFGTTHTLFHGDISPNNIICEARKDEKTGKTFPRLMLTDLSNIGDLSKLMWTPGWASPECIQFAKTHTKYQEMCTSDFLGKYGAVKDAWAMGLILGSLLRGGFHPQYEDHLPRFSFITSKLTIDDSGRVVDERGLADITQEEIDRKIDVLIAEASSDGVKALWNCVKKYLTIDPEGRPTMAEYSISMS